MLSVHNGGNKEILMESFFDKRVRLNKTLKEYHRYHHTFDEYSGNLRFEIENA